MKNGNAHKCCPSCREAARARRQGMNEEQRAHLAVYMRNLRKQYRAEAITAYGGKCACCGESEYTFLVIDHPNGGGRKEREALRMWASSFIRDLARRGYPTGYRVLCHNCNSSYGYYGYCPHQRSA